MHCQRLSDATVVEFPMISVNEQPLRRFLSNNRIEQQLVGMLQQV